MIRHLKKNKEMFDEFKMTSMIIKFFPLGQKVLKRLRYSFEIVALYCFVLFGLFRLGRPLQQFFREIVKFSREFKLKCFLRNRVFSIFKLHEILIITHKPKVQRQHEIVLC